MIRLVLCLGVLLFTSGCITRFVRDPVSQNPDHRIVVAPAAPGSQHMKAYAPECPPWSRHAPDVDDNMPQPQLGCANQRNLALTIETPTDLVAGRRLGPANAEYSASALQRYQAHKVTGLYDPQQPPAPVSE